MKTQKLLSAFFFLLSLLFSRQAFTQAPQLVKDIQPGPGSGGYGKMVVDNNLILFPADDGINGVELWRSDGTESGTVLVKDIRLGSATSSLQFLTVMNEKVYFKATDAI